MYSENMRQSWSTVKKTKQSKKPTKNQTNQKSLIKVAKSRLEAEVLK